MAGRVTLGLSVLLLAAGWVFGVHASNEYSRLRAEWRAEAARLAAGDPGYSAQASDRVYARALRQRKGAERAGGLAGLALTAVVLVWRFRRPADGTEGSAPIASPRRAHLATIVDGAAACALLWLGSQIGLWLSPEEAGWGMFLSRFAFGAALALGWGGLSAGRSLGARLTGARVMRAALGVVPGIGRGLAALLLSPFAWPHSVLAFVLRWPRGPLHLGWTGLETRLEGQLGTGLAEPAHTPTSHRAEI